MTEFELHQLAEIIFAKLKAETTLAVAKPGLSARLPIWLTVAQVARIAQTCEQTIRRHIHANRRGLRKFVSDVPFKIHRDALPVVYKVTLPDAVEQLWAQAPDKLAA